MHAPKYTPAELFDPCNIKLGGSKGAVRAIMVDRSANPSIIHGHTHTNTMFDSSL
jgi:hypothetical protein